MTTQPTLTPAAFAQKWRAVTTIGKASAQPYFIDLCRMPVPEVGLAGPAEHGTPGWIEFDSMINVRPRQGTRTRSVDDPEIRRTITTIVDRLVTP